MNSFSVHIFVFPFHRCIFHFECCCCCVFVCVCVCVYYCLAEWSTGRKRYIQCTPNNHNGPTGRNCIWKSTAQTGQCCVYLFDMYAWKIYYIPAKFIKIFICVKRASALLLVQHVDEWENKWAPLRPQSIDIIFECCTNWICKSCKHKVAISYCNIHWFLGSMADHKVVALYICMHEQFWRGQSIFQVHGTRHRWTARSNWYLYRQNCTLLHVQYPQTWWAVRFATINDKFIIFRW